MREHETENEQYCIAEGLMLALADAVMGFGLKASGLLLGISGSNLITT